MGRYDQIEPQLLRRLDGGWLAVSGPGAWIRIGVVADTEEEARQRFQQELAAWVKLRDKTDAETGDLRS